MSLFTLFFLACMAKFKIHIKCPNHSTYNESFTFLTECQLLLSAREQLILKLANNYRILNSCVNGEIRNSKNIPTEQI